MLNKALTDGLDEELARDERVFVMGTDIEMNLMGRTQGLATKYPGRVRDAPISEHGVLGAGVGAAATGMRPVVDLMMSNFLYVAFDQLANNAGKLRYMMGGSEPPAHGSREHRCTRWNGRPAFGFTVRAGHQCRWNQSRDAVNPGGRQGALQIGNPRSEPGVVPCALALGAVTGEVPDEEYLTPLGKGRVLREGQDVTVVAMGLMAHRALEAAEQLEQEGTSVEVVDPRTLHPLDHDTIITSVEKTGRLVVVDEARRSCSLGSEIVARVSTDSFGALRAAPRIVANPDVHIPFAPELERQVIPQVAHIVESIRSLETSVTV